MTNLYDLFLSYAPIKRKHTPSGWLSFDCPCCLDQGEARPDTKQRGGVRTDLDGSIVYNCFNCGFKTRYVIGDHLPKKMGYLLEKLGVPQQDVEKLRFNIAKEIREHQKSDANQTATANLRIPQFKELPLPKDAKPIDYWANLDHPPKDFLEAIEYLYGRGEEIFHGYSYYWTPQPLGRQMMNHRIIIPYFYRDEIVGWTARYVRDDNKAIRYLKDVQPDYLFNNQALMRRDRKYVLVFEGEFDAIPLDGVSPLGRKLSRLQANWLKQSGKEVIIVGDREIKDVNLVDFAIEYGFSASFPVWQQDVKDNAEAVRRYGRLYALKTILDNVERDRFKIMMGKKRIRSY